MYYNQELGLCIEFGPVRVDSVRRGGACYLSFTPSSLKCLGEGEDLDFLTSFQHGIVIDRFLCRTLAIDLASRCLCRFHTCATAALTDSHVSELIANGC